MPKMSVGIVDYGLGNLRSVAGAVARLNHEPVVTADPGRLAETNKLILPGVGAFGDGMTRLHQRNLVDVLTDLVMERGKPILGICLGSQLFARDSVEFGEHEGLGWVDARVERIAPGNGAVRIPHVGWNDLIQTHECILFDGIPADALVYYVHSYHVRCADPALVVAETDYGQRMTAAYRLDNIYATQFHPEKSQQHGLRLMHNFLERAQ